MAKDQFGDHDAFFFVHLDRDTVPVIVDGDLVFLSVDGNLDERHGLIVDLQSAQSAIGSPYYLPR